MEEIVADNPEKFLSGDEKYEVDKAIELLIEAGITPYEYAGFYADYLSR